MTDKALFVGYSIHPDAALELFSHHVMMAQRLFETMDENIESVSTEICRIMDSAGFNVKEKQAAMVFVVALWEYYEELSND